MPQELGNVLAGVGMSDAVVGAIVGAIIAIVLFVLAAIALVLVANWHIFKKLGLPGWNSLVPFYSTVKELEATNLPTWWIFLFLVPFVNIVLLVILLRRLAGVFGKGAWFTVGMIFLPFIFLPILAFGKAKYKNIYPEPKPMSEATKYALIAAFACSVLYMGGSSRTEFHPPLHFFDQTGYAADDTYVYYYDTLISKADARTFEVVDDSYGTYDAKDKRYYYYQGEIVSEKQEY